MIRLCGAEANLATLLALARAQLAGQQETSASLREGLCRFLGEIQPDIPRDPAKVSYLIEGDEHHELLAIFDSGSRLDDTDYHFESPESCDEGRLKLDRIRHALDDLGAADPVFRSTFDLAMFTVFWAPCGIAGGGTTSQALGVLWADPRPSWSERDLREFLIHELSHTLLFFDEWRQPLYGSRDALTDRSSYALSAIRGTSRPLDKVLHSIIVGTEVFIAREELLGHTMEDGLHPASPKLRSSILDSVTSIREVSERRDVLTPHALELVDRCETMLSASQPVAASA